MTDARMWLCASCAPKNVESLSIGALTQRRCEGCYELFDGSGLSCFRRQHVEMRLIRALQLARTMKLALEEYDRENAGAADKHPPDCSCAGCQLVAAGRELVAAVERDRSSDG